MIIDLQKFSSLIKKGDYEIIGLAYPIASVIGSLGYLLFYFVDRSLGLYDNFYLRVIIATLFIQLIFCKNNFTSLKVFIVESILALCLPLFYSYFYFATNESISWGSGIIFCGFTYGFLTGRIAHTITVFPMFIMIGFFLYDRFYMEATISQFFHGSTILSLSILSAVLSSIFKLTFECVLLTDITIIDQQKRQIKDEKLKGSIDYNLNLKKNLNKVKKLDTVSKLAGGLIDDFNEMKEIIAVKSMELKSLYLDNNEKVQRIDTVLDVVKKSSAMIESISAFAKNSNDRYCFTDVNYIVNESVRLIKESVNDDINIKVDLAAQNTGINGDIEILEQVFINICINAIQAMPHGGELFIMTKNQLFSDDSDSGNNGNEQIVISFRDTGLGMDQKTKENIFKPFFSTKDAGKGRGFGLAMVYENIKRHNGLITVDSVPLKGTTFSISLPVKSFDAK